MANKLNRVAITGMGAICGLGDNLSDIWKGITHGKSGISTIEHHDTTNLPITFAGEVKNFQLAENILSERESRRYDRFVNFALHATNEALSTAGLLESNSYSAEDQACILGVGMGGFPAIEKNHNLLLEKGARRVSPFFIPAIIPNMAPGAISIRYGLKGLNYNISSACASASHAISSAAMEIMTGRYDLVITGGSESPISGLPIAGFASMKALSKKNDSPETASRPFDSGRDGFVIGEGAGIIILENLEKAKARGATIFAEVAGFGACSDAFHITAPESEGEGAARCMNQAIKTASISKEQIGYINAHGTSTPLGDIAETKAVKKVFNKHAYNLNVSSTKSMVGHLLGAAGGIETIFSAMSLKEQIIPPTINLVNQDPECDLNYTPNKSIQKEFEYALNNSFGFGGTNSSIILKRY